ncbi:MAG: efflux RND transporter periplasmic adaptor subunit [Verrucomicrobiales bacterium]
MLKRLWQLGLHEYREHRGYVIPTILVGILSLVIVLGVIWPGYRDPNSRMYTSGLGYASVKRKLGTAFDVQTVLTRREKVSIPYMGEGLIAGEPLRVPVIPMATITAVNVKEGDLVKEGDELVVLDAAAALRNLASAELAVNTARAELERVRIGSAYVLAQERPEHDKIELDSASAEQRFLEAKLSTNRDMLARGLIAKEKVLEIERALQKAKSGVREAEFFSSMSERGYAHSKLIAENALKDAEQALAFRKTEMERHTVRAPADGIVSAVLVREGEYNQDTGKPALLLTTGLWFEGYFDQAVLSRIEVGQTAEIYLEAFPGKRWQAQVERIVPEVTFAEGGPEISRPMRPRGTGSPEWAATFRVRFAVDAKPADGIALGMTGNVRVLTEKEAVIVPRNAVLSMAAGRGLVMVPTADDGWEVRPVGVGYIGDTWIEVSSGLEAGEEIISQGHRILKEGDKIDVEKVDW